MPSIPTWSSAGFLTEAPESGSIVSDSRGQFLQQIYHGTRAQCEASVVAWGAYGTGALANYTCDRCAVIPQKGDAARMEITWLRPAGGGGGGGGDVLPPDEYDLVPDDASPRIERHSKFKTMTGLQRRKAIDVATKSYEPTEAGEAQRAAEYNAMTELQRLLYDKIAEGHETFYFSGWRYTWTAYSWVVLPLVGGGYVESPGGPLAGFISSGVWLRLKDSLSVRNGIFAITHTWLGAEAWDEDIYPNNP
jgi:hypothetical protein